MGNTMFSLEFQFPILQEIYFNQTQGILQNRELPKIESTIFRVLLEISRLIGFFSFLNNPQEVPHFVAFEDLNNPWNWGIFLRSYNMGNTMFGLGFQFPVLQEICSNQTKGILQNGEFPKFEAMSFNALLELFWLIGSFSFLNNL